MVTKTKWDAGTNHPWKHQNQSKKKEEDWEKEDMLHCKVPTFTCGVKDEVCLFVLTRKCERQELEKGLFGENCAPIGPF